MIESINNTTFLLRSEEKGGVGGHFVPHTNLLTIVILHAKFILNKCRIKI